MCITEHWLNDHNIEYVKIDGYKKISSFCRKNYLHGGSAIFVKSSILSDCCEVDIIQKSSIEKSFECSAVGFLDRILVITIYRPPLSVIKDFLEFIDKLLETFLGKYKHLIVTGDLSINGLKANYVDPKLFREILSSYNMLSLINTPTRIITRADGLQSSTQVDYIITNIPEIVTAKNIDPGFSDHLAQYIEWNFAGNNITIM